MSAANTDEKWLPYRHSMPKESPPELIVPHAIPQDERIWVPVDDNEDNCLQRKIEGHDF